MWLKLSKVTLERNYLEFSNFYGTNKWDQVVAGHTHQNGDVEQKHHDTIERELAMMILASMPYHF